MPILENEHKNSVAKKLKRLKEEIIYLLGKAKRMKKFAQVDFSQVECTDCTYAIKSDGNGTVKVFVRGVGSSMDLELRTYICRNIPEEILMRIGALIVEVQ